MEQTIYIIGAGAIGKTLAVSLKLNHKNVILLRGSLEEPVSYTEKIRVVSDDQTELEAEIPVSTLPNFPVLDGLIVLTNKSYGNAKLARTLKDKVGESPLVILQNGLGVEQPFIDHNFAEVYRCVLFVTSQLTDESTVRFKPVSASLIGTIKGNANHLKSIVNQLDGPTFRFKLETDIQPIIWKKAIINCVFNSICPLLEVDNGIFHRDDKALEVARRVIGECVSMARTQGIALSPAEITESLLLISKSSDGQPISTWQDIRNRRKTEIETLNFEIIKIARQLNQEAMVKETKLLGELTLLKSEWYGLNSPLP